MNKVALFDFCETLIKFQTADAFIDYVYEKTRSKRMYRIEKARYLFHRIRAPYYLNKRYALWERWSLNKRWRLYELKGFDENKLKELALSFYRERLIPNVINPVIKEMEIRKAEGFKIGIVSGGFDLYIEHFAKDFNVDFYLSSKVGFKNNKCTGKIDGADCMREEKVNELMKRLKDKPSICYFYSDSISDLPLLLWASNGIVVSKNKHQDWINKYNLKEIIWN